MGVKVATGCCLNWSQPSISHSPSSSKRRSLTDFSLVCRYVHPSSSSSSFGAKLNRSRSCETFISSKPQKSSIKRIVSATFDSHYSGEEFKFSPDIHDFTVRFQLSDDDVTDSDDDVTKKPDSGQLSGGVSKWFGDMIPASIERKANSVDLPFSLRIIQKKKQWEEGFREAGEFAYCSMKKAFSSMVFIIRELQSYTLQMREVLFVEDLQEILMRVQKEMNASFVWLFQQVFSHTPNLMVCVMILLANYSVYSMSNQVGVVGSLPSATVETVSTVADQTNSEFDSSTVKTYSVTPGGKTTSIGGINGGGGKFRPATSGTDGDGRFDQQNEHQTIVPDGPSSSTLNPTSTSEELVSGEAEELVLWKSIEAEAEKMREVSKVAGLDSETMRRFVSPVNVKMEEEVDTGVYLKTELVYQMGLLEEPDNPLLLANYAQFLYLFYHDHTRAEEYFKKATKIEPKDAEAFNKYASFLWHAKNDLWAAEESFLEAISADPNNPFYTATYSHFLWSNGADDTCFPLGSPENVNSDEA
ncbi:putative tetratricopeptide-like helical domain superfamily [Helianthus annuus]|uniref:Putative tetratricopeptide-like helical domain-containing protein n=1 Tax=Helianthus annuus TaxID=4232 RepID=A0A251VMI9_HELAN|nr:uncharacterized protein LOC110868834 [Helianthus annuus]KAF5821652.1 putative tetratricopeptide-like helical domain superfamily [Helianthus annuus]KAJ0611296.1 putative tetratricopeptide-like helical domain superfamily [Helianthus annuus]KAJ0626571.1 putative tetratricopeptide-like helical domain superfamily [Helianthus annuus]KAJ0947589.1 putative tetratricopeptide-like helical domain superfamily [Helianthus annuus]KAJ0956532.1 putative tetratricopeptide-like helical domain superfamily [He